MTAQQVCQHGLLRLRHSEYPVQFLILRTKVATATEESDAKDGIAIPIDPLTSQAQPSVSIRAGEGPTRRGGAAGKKEFLHTLLKARINGREYSGSILDIPTARERRTSSSVVPQDPPNGRAPCRARWYHYV